MSVDTKKTKVIASWEDLKPFGFDFLSAEPCPFKTRVLMDLNASAVKIVAGILGLDSEYMSVSMRKGINDVNRWAIYIPNNLFPDIASMCLLMDQPRDILMWEVVAAFSSGTVVAYNGYSYDEIDEIKGQDVFDHIVVDRRSPKVVKVQSEDTVGVKDTAMVGKIKVTSEEAATFDNTLGDQDPANIHMLALPGDTNPCSVTTYNGGTFVVGAPQRKAGKGLVVFKVKRIEDFETQLEASAGLRPGHVFRHEGFIYRVRWTIGEDRGMGNAVYEVEPLKFITQADLSDSLKTGDEVLYDGWTYKVGVQICPVGHKIARWVMIPNITEAITF